MRALLLTSMILMLGGCVGVSPMGTVQDSDAWTKFVSEEGRFSVLLPSSPAVERRVTNTESAPSVLNIFVSEGHRSAYVIVYRDLQPEITSRLTTEEILETTDDSARSNPGQEVLSFEPIHVRGLPGRAISIRDSRTGAVTQTRAFLVDSRLYSVGATTPSADSSPEDVSRFFESFEIVR